MPAKKKPTTKGRLGNESRLNDTRTAEQLEAMRLDRGWQANNLKCHATGWTSRRAAIRAAMSAMRVSRAEAAAWFDARMAKTGGKQ
ncbi:hypothetical protein E0E54_11560 [Azotobacter chroococcum]|uniref:hypothetical protein n=1 Tax=Azotobacter chroococcum TaxID=353 RepID=UPI001038BA4E|nr:hypothetical protein [Azotobacter chroococcum]TBW35694.1 hypothetical protein E0E54_11560 [Azotobacter chroococcum]